MILPTSLSLLNAIFTGKARGHGFAVWGSTIEAAAAIGPDWHQFQYAECR